MKPEVDIDRLCKAAYRSCMSLARPRENVNAMVRQYAGDNYAEDGAELRLPLNFIGLFHRIVLPKLVSDNPRMALATWQSQERQTVATMQDVGNEAFQHMRLGHTLEKTASAALFNSGWLKVGRATSADEDRYAWKLQKGQVFASHIALDDICFDIHARSIDEAYFIGHRFRAPLWKIKDDPRYGKRRKDLTATEDKMYSELGVERTSMILRGYYGQDNDLWDMVELWEFYVPSVNMTVVVTSEDIFGGASEPLLEEEWIGPKGGTPYHLLGFGPVPENLLPKAPIPDFFSMHEDTNNLLRKLIMQGKDQKKVLPIVPGSEGDGKRLQDTSNGEVFECTRPEQLKELNFGGPDQANFQLMMTLKELLDWSSGNMSALGGLASQGKTLGQEKIVTETSSATVSDMQRRTVDFAAEVCEHVLWYLWKDPFTSYDQPLAMPGLDIFIPRTVTPEDRRKVPFEKLRMTLEPYSLQRQTPVEVDAQLTQLVTGLITPMLPILQAQGTAFDAQAFMKIKAQLLNRPELLEILKLQDPPMDSQLPSSDKPGMPQSTSREYIRSNRSERTLEGDHQERVTAMMQTNGEAE